MDFREIAARVPILDAASFLGLEVKQARSPCPACNRGGERALQFFTDTQKFKCWGAEQKTWGDSIQLVAHIKGITMTEAAALLVSHNGLSSIAKPAQKKMSFDMEKYRESLTTEHELLTKAGITPDLAKEIGCGVAPKGAHQGKLVIPLYNRTGKFLVYAAADGLKLPTKWREA
jgi:hypothetical protein